jgi:hypothetical protein
MTVGFENHSHMYKRTMPIRNETADPTGTLYIGDGGWGVNVYEPGDYWYLAKAAAKRNFLHVVVGQHNMTLSAVDDTGDVFDSVVVR